MLIIKQSQTLNPHIASLSLCKRLLNQLKSKTTHELIQHNRSWKVFCLRPSPNNITAFCSENSFYTFFCTDIVSDTKFSSERVKADVLAQKVFLEVFLTPDHESIDIILLHFCFLALDSCLNHSHLLLFCHCQQCHSDDLSGFQFY